MRASTQVQQCGESIADLLHLVGAGYSELGNESLFRGGFDLVHHGDSRTATTADGDEQRKLRLIVRAGDRHDHERAAEAVERLAGEDDGRASLLISEPMVGSKLTNQISPRFMALGRQNAPINHKERKELKEEL